jgi:hypothetical protein
VQRTDQLVVTTPSGLKIVLEDAGWDNAGNKLWRQVESGFEGAAPPWSV